MTRISKAAHREHMNDRAERRHHDGPRAFYARQLKGGATIPANLSRRHPDRGLTLVAHLANKAKRLAKKAKHT